MSTPKPILVCGDAMVDEYWYGEVSRISPEAPVPVVKVIRQEDRFGAADNVAANIQALGGTFISATCNTARKIRLIGRNQQVARVDFDWTPKEEDLQAMEQAFLAALPKCSIVVFSDYGKGSLARVDELILRAKNSLILVDPKGHDYARYAGADLIKPNTDELRQVVGGWSDEHQLKRKVQALLTTVRIKHLLLTQASEGMTFFTKEGSSHFPSEAREVYDVTGAGDTAIAALAVSLSEEYGWLRAVHYANKAAGIVCGKFGTAVATKEEVYEAG